MESSDTECGAGFRSGRAVVGAGRIPHRRRTAHATNIITLLEWAGERITAMHVGGTKPRGFSVAWPEYTRDIRDAYGYTAVALRAPIPSAAEITTMDTILGWTAFIPDTQHRRAVVLRSLIHPIRQRHILSWAQIGAIMWGSESTAKRAYERGIATLEELLSVGDIAAVVGLMGLQNPC